MAVISMIFREKGLNFPHQVVLKKIRSMIITAETNNNLQV